MLDFHWYLPRYPDSRDIVGGKHDQSAGAAGGDHPATLDYLTRVCAAAEQMGFQGPVAARQADVYLTRGAPVPTVAETLACIREGARREGRPMQFGIRLHVITRDTSEAAWAEAQRMLGRRGGRGDALTLAANLWTGAGLGRIGAGTALVGSHAEVAARIEEYADLGISEFVLSGHPALEEVYRFGEGVLPALRSRGLWNAAEESDVPARSAAGRVPFAVV